MPYKIQRKGSKFALVRRNGTVKSRHSTRAKAESADRTIRAKEHGWKPTGKRRKR